MQRSTAVEETPIRSPRPRRRHALGRPGLRRAARVAVQTPDRTIVDRLAGPAALLICVLLSLASHAGVTATFAALGLFRPPVPTRPPAKIRMTVVEKERPPPPPPPQPKPKPAPEPPKVHPIRLVRHFKPPPVPPPPTPPPPQPLPQAAPPPPNAVAAKPSAAPLMVGLSMSSTSTAGSMAVPVGNTLYGAPSRVAPKPKDVKPYRSPDYVPSYSLAQQPEYTDNLSSDAMKKFYPAEARRDGDEAQTLVKLEIDDKGNVTKVTVVGKPGHGFAEASRLFGLRMKFKPGRDAHGKACATTLSWTINWELD